jgi:hypothetical protein
MLIIYNNKEVSNEAMLVFKLWHVKYTNQTKIFWNFVWSFWTLSNYKVLNFGAYEVKVVCISMWYDIS